LSVFSILNDMYAEWLLKHFSI